MTDKAVHAFIEGRVQGVWFRGWTCAQADALGLQGWVRNLADGRVEAWIEGPSAQVELLVEKLWQGPPASKVTNVQAQSAEPEAHSGFQQRPKM